MGLLLVLTQGADGSEVLRHLVLARTEPHRPAGRVAQAALDEVMVPAGGGAGLLCAAVAEWHLGVLVVHHRQLGHRQTLTVARTAVDAFHWVKN